MDISWVRRIGSQLDYKGGGQCREMYRARGGYPVPNDECHRSFEGLFQLRLAVIVRLRFWGGGFDLNTRTGVLEKSLRSRRCEGVDAVDLDGHCLDIALS